MRGEHGLVEFEAVIEECKQEVDGGGFTVAAIVGDDSGCDWAYTIGLDRSFGHPELLVIGLEAPIAGAILEVLGNRIAAGETISSRMDVAIEGGLEFRMHTVDPLWRSQGDWFNLGREVMSCWGERWPASIQLTWSDPDVGFPQQPGDPRWGLRQPLLFSA